MLPLERLSSSCARARMRIHARERKGQERNALEERSGQSSSNCSFKRTPSKCHAAQTAAELPPSNRTKTSSRSTPSFGYKPLATPYPVWTSLNTHQHISHQGPAKARQVQHQRGASRNPAVLAILFPQCLPAWPSVFCRYLFLLRLQFVQNVTKCKGILIICENFCFPVSL